MQLVHVTTCILPIQKYKSTYMDCILISKNRRLVPQLSSSSERGLAGYRKIRPTLVSVTRYITNGIEGIRCYCAKCRKGTNSVHLFFLGAGWKKASRANCLLPSAPRPSSSFVFLALAWKRRWGMRNILFKNKFSSNSFPGSCSPSNFSNC